MPCGCAESSQHRGGGIQGITLHSMHVYAACLVKVSVRALCLLPPFC